MAEHTPGPTCEHCGSPVTYEHPLTGRPSTRARPVAPASVLRAAPDLLAACDHALGALLHEESADNAARMVAAAIRKARGES